MACADTLGPGLAVLSSAISTGKVTGTKLYAKYLQGCPQQAAAAMQKAAIHKIDDKAMCQVMCCCRNVEMSGGRQYKQNCVAATLKRADNLLGGKSRYKPEVSYNMETDPPSPFMRQAPGQETVPRSAQGAISDAKKAISYYEPGEGMVRRPDVVIVEDPSQPPIQSNIDRIVEMKFPGDGEGMDQYADYAEIAGSRGKLKVLDANQGDCNCKPDDAEPEPVPAPATELEMAEARAPNYAAYAMLGLAAVALVGVGVAVVLAPEAAPLEAEAGSAAAGAFGTAWGEIFGGAAAAGGL